MTIKKKLILSFTFLLLLLAGLGITSIISLKTVDNTSTVIDSEIIPQINRVQTLNFEVARIRSHEFQHIILTDAASMDDLEKRINDLQSSIETLIKEYQEYDNNEYIKIIDTNWSIYMTEHKKIIQASRQMDTQGALTLVKGDSKVAYDKITNAITVLVDASKSDSAAVSAKGDSTYSSVRNIIVLIIIIGIITGTILELYIIHSITTPIRKMKLRLLDLVQKGGDLTHKIDIKSKDEIGELAAAVNQFIANIRTIIIEVNQCTEGVENAVLSVVDYMKDLSSNVEQSSATIQELSAGMEETAAAAEEVNSSSVEIENATVSMADRAQKGAISANEISNRADELMQSAINSQKVSKKVYENTKTNLETALEKSKAIEKISVLSDTILGISTQTNLLALNAAIEAARAGEAGKGFAVVADEIRNLAESSKNTVSEIQKVTAEVLTSVNDLSSSSRTIMEFFDTTVLKDYDEMVNTGEAYGNDGKFVDDLVNDFSSTAEELTATIEGIMKAMSEVATTVNEGAMGTQEIAEKISEIVTMVEQVKNETDISLKNSKLLKKAVNKFTV
ncbi:methyl-accepting chemotaxis protein [[Clostridium] fimetarium]|uniref:Methyl-accepting chemotaxis protein n=1 Tax=[Clostridium] fimetarium TaxID=99656 RepID=A0A1I0QZW3_9FIRM|nr:methyl-accepting chemotaxis protein [[Clostridium] fimetarium]SEW33268.1 methyl-accepting chemotaxis protein [[Clostridium] fimetarium]